MKSNGGSKRTGSSAEPRSRASLIKVRPAEFVKKPTYLEDSDGDDSTVGKMPPADSDDEEGLMDEE